MNKRLKLTNAERNEVDNVMSYPEPTSAKAKYDPPVIFKEHYLSHLTEDIRNLGPLPLLKTDLFESKVSKDAYDL